MTECWSHLTLSPRGHSILPALGLAVMCLVHPVAWAQDTTSEAIAVPDASLRAVLEDGLGLSAGAQIPATELARLTVLEAPDAGIVDLTGLEHATGLTRLDLGPGTMRDPWANTNRVSDLTPLAGLTALTWLDLSGNSVEDVTPLSGLTGLTHLNLEVNDIPDISALSSLLASLNYLYLAFNPLPADEEQLVFADGPNPDLEIYAGVLSGPYLFPNLGSNLNHMVYAYRDALARGRVTSGVAPGPCAWEFSSGEFRTWDSSMPAPSIPVRVWTETSEDIDTVSNYLQVHGIAPLNSWKGGSEDAIKGLLSACVPVPLLVSVAELPGVGVVRRHILPSDLPTGVGSKSWGEVKGFRQ